MAVYGLFQGPQVWRWERCGGMKRVFQVPQVRSWERRVGMNRWVQGPTGKNMENMENMAMNSLFQAKRSTNKEIRAVCGCFHYFPGPTGKEIGACVAAYNVLRSTG